MIIFFIKAIELVCAHEKPRDIEIFNEYVDVYVSVKGEKGSNRYQLNVVSYKWLDERNKEDLNNEGEYFRFVLVMRYYDESAIERHVKRIIKKCSLDNREKSFNCLKHHLLYEYEEFEY